MLFNSWEYVIFLPLVFAIYWGIGRGNQIRKNGILLLASYVFYGWWDYRFLGLIVLSSATDYLIGLQLGKKKANYYYSLALASI